MLKIEMVRGDYQKIKFKIKNGNLLEFDEIYITFKKNCYTDEMILQKRLSSNEIIKDEEGNYHFEILPFETEKLDYGKYMFDIELCKENNPKIKKTFLGELEIMKEVTFVCNERGQDGK